MWGLPPLHDSWSKVHQTTHDLWNPHPGASASGNALSPNWFHNPSTITLSLSSELDTLDCAPRTVDSSSNANSASQWCGGISPRTSPWYPAAKKVCSHQGHTKRQRAERRERYAHRTMRQGHNERLQLEHCTHTCLLLHLKNHRRILVLRDVVARHGVALREVGVG